MRFDVRATEDVDALENQLRMSGKLTPIAKDATGDERSIRRVEDIPSVFGFAKDSRAFVVAGCIPEASITMLTSESGQGKTMLALNAAACVSNGAPFCGRETTRRQVLYMDKENPAHVIAERLQRFGVSDSEYLRIWGCWCSEEPPAADSTIVGEWVMDTDPKPLIVVDSLIAFHPGSENDSAETRQFMHGFRRLASLGATVLLLHHSGKAETAKDYRGSSDIKAAIDIGYHMANIGEPTKLELARLRAFKQRFPTETEMLFKFGDEGFEACRESARLTATESLIELLKAHPKVRVHEFGELAAEEGLGRDRARTFLSTYAKSGKVLVERGEHNTRFHTWAGTENQAQISGTPGSLLVGGL